MRRAKKYLEKDLTCAGLFVSPDGRFTTSAQRGFEYMTREQISGEVVPPAEAPAPTKEKFNKRHK
jgi:hypothetical protein